MNDLAQMTALDVDKMTEQLTAAYTAVIRSGGSFRLIPSVMLWGPPGVGKSQGVRQAAKRLEEETGKKVIVTDVRLMLFNPIDLRGIPAANADRTLAVWLKPKIFQMDESSDVVNILFLDELSAAPQSVQAAAYQIVLDRVIGEHRLPENCIVIAAGNRVTDRSVAFKMPRALANRLCHFDIVPSFDSWNRWAVENGINEKVLGFLSFDRSCLFDSESVSDLAFVTPRSWEMVSSLLNTVSSDPEEIYPMISGCIGVGRGVEFLSWCKVYDQLPDIEAIFSGKSQPVPKNTDALYALISSMTAYARGHLEDMEKIGASVRYAMGLPPEFSTVLMRNYMAFERDYRQKLLRIPQFGLWLQKFGRLLNGA